MEPADARGKLIGRTAAAGVLDGIDCGTDAIHAVADGVRKVAVEQQELENAIGNDVCGVDLAVGLECRATTEQTHQLEVMVTGVLPLLRVEQFGLVNLKHGSGGIGALQVAAEANELPALTVNHG